MSIVAERILTVIYLKSITLCILIFRFFVGDCTSIKLTNLLNSLNTISRILMALDPGVITIGEPSPV